MIEVDRFIHSPVPLFDKEIISGLRQRRQSCAKEKFDFSFAKQPEKNDEEISISLGILSAPPR